MEEKYSLEKDGTYCLGFPNKFALSEKEIEEIFSDFGDVISVRTSGDERGFRFVRYRTLEEAECAVQGLNGHKKIRILPKKPKVTNNNGKGKENQRNGQQKNLGAKKKVNEKNKKKDDDNEDWNDSFNEDSSSTHSINKHKSQLYGGAYNGSFKIKSPVANSEEDSTDTSETENLMKILRLRSLRGQSSSKNFVPNLNLNVHEDETKTKINQSHDEDEKINRDVFNPRQLNKNVKTKTHKAVDSSLKLMKEENENLLKKIRRYSSQGNSERNSSNLPNDNEPPELISTDELKQRTSKVFVRSDNTVKTILAEEVIVANINEKSSVLYILYLLEKFDPISITEIKTISKNGIRYCSVYFKSQKDAIAVEKEYDNFELSGNKLIVRTPQLLIKEVSTD
ncbi:uncharacterized protein LOC127285100 [Leptopilina boulardi]|uniref:uncharacterized protein LOC127285100 n=1 Tax=Leptopilina boulardi TaxID=63433 RepID=UPI0021F61AD8|nr:uncharacterized protein LOC127285100 [Leptopilina boulardi]